MYCMLSYQNGCCLQAIAVIPADIILFLSDWLCSSQYFVVEFALQEEFLPEGSWKTVRQDVNRGASPPAVSAALLGGLCLCLHAIKNIVLAGLRQSLQQKLRGSL